MEINVRIETPDLSAAILKLVEVWAQPVEPASASAVAAAAKVAEAAMPQVPATPTAPAPVTPAPTTPAPAPGPAAAPVPTAGPGAATAPGNTPAPVVPVAAAPSYSMEQIATAGTALVDAGKRDQLLALLSRFGLQAVTQLQPAQYGAFAAELRALGAQI